MTKACWEDKWMIISSHKQVEDLRLGILDNAEKSLERLKMIHRISLRSNSLGQLSSEKRAETRCPDSP